MKSLLLRFLCLPLVGAMLGACAGKTQVSLAAKSSFASPTAAEPEPLTRGAPAIAALLSKGGYLIYLRHGRTQYDQIELERTNRAQGNFDLARCETQRQLSDAGRAELKIAAGQFRMAAIPLDPGNLTVIMARIGPAEWGAIAQASAR